MQHIAKRIINPMISKLAITDSGIAINGIKIPSVKEINYHTEPDSIPQCSITLDSAFEFNGDADVKFEFSIESLKQAVECIKFYAEMDDHVYDKLVERIWDGLTNSDDSDCSHDVAINVLEALLDTEI